MLLFIQRKRPSSSSVPRFLCRAQFQPIATPTLEQSFGLTQIHGDRVLGGCSVPYWSAGEASEVSEIGEVDFSSPAGHLHTWLFWGENQVWWFTTVRMFNIIISVITVSYGNIYGTYFNNFNKNNTIFTDAFLTWYDVEYYKKATFTTAGMFDLADFWFKYLFLQWLSFPKTPKASVSLPRTEPEPG